ncbi:MAG TPA: hypothetical protein VL098_09830 [Flavipsychrobacter sp.]|nr:hypothetical protein [Flavipsychrobacter sp.]
MSTGKKRKDTDPITEEEEVKKSNDPKIDQDVPGFPHHPSKPEDIKKKKPGEEDEEK